MKKSLLILGLLVTLLTACSGGAKPTDIAPAPDFTLPNALGGEVSLDDYSGKDVLLFFHMAVG